MCDFFCSFPCEIRKIVVPLHSLLRTTVQNEAKQTAVTTHVTTADKERVL